MADGEIGAADLVAVGKGFARLKHDCKMYVSEALGSARLADSMKPFHLAENRGDVPKQSPARSHAIEAIALQLLDENSEVRGSAAIDLAGCGVLAIQAVRPLLFVALNDPDDEVRIIATKCAIEIVTPLSSAFRQSRDVFLDALCTYRDCSGGIAATSDRLRLCNACDALLAELAACGFVQQQSPGTPRTAEPPAFSRWLDVKEDVMDDLVLSEAQARLVLGSDSALAVRDEKGIEIGVLIPHGDSGKIATAELKPEVAHELLRRMSQQNIRWSTTQEVLQRLGRRGAS